MKKPKSTSDSAPETMPSGEMINMPGTEPAAAAGETYNTGTASNIGLDISDMPPGSMAAGAVRRGENMPAGNMAGVIKSSEAMALAETPAGNGLAIREMPTGAIEASASTSNAPAGTIQARSANKPKSVTQAELQSMTRSKSYVPKSSGLKLGSFGADVERLQNYLKQFGYVAADKPQTFAVPERAEPLPAPVTGEFDGETVKALKSFQAFNHMPVTGVLDEATLDLMSKPRCGFPDVAEYTLQGSKWTRTALTYGFNEFTSDLGQTDVRNAIAQAFALWAAVTPLRFTEVPIASNPDIVIRFVAGNHGDGNNFDGSSGVLAHAYYPPPGGGALAGDTHFDEAETWTVNLPPSGIDLVTVAAHEFGHALGLAHSSVAGALMAPYYTGAHRNLESDDIAGIRALYGTGGGWASLGGVITSNIATGRNADGRLEIFARGTDNGLWHKWQTAPNNGWSGWVSLGGIITTDPTVINNADGRMEVFARGTDNAVWHRWQTAPSNGWSGWSSLGGIITSNIGAGRNADGRLELFVRGTDNALWHKWQTAPSNGWSGWSSLGGVITSNPVVINNADGRMEVFALGTDNAVWHQWQTAPNNGWSGWASLGGVITSNIGAGRNSDGRLEVFARGTDYALWHKWQTAPNNGWSGWFSLGGVITTDSMVINNADGRMEVFARGTDNAVWHRWQTAPSNGWSGWSSLGGVITSKIAAHRNADGRLELFVRGADSGVWHRWQTAPSNGWS